MKGFRSLLFPLLSLSLFFSSCLGNAPRISSIDPRIGTMGEVLTIHGSGFGKTRSENRVTLAGIAPTASSYIEWTPDRIAVRIPDFGESGLVYVYASGKKSNAALFTNRASMPLLVSETDAGSVPRVLSVEPAAAKIGSLLTISGRNFGASRENSSVLFAWDADINTQTASVARAPDSLEVSDLELGYEYWSDRELRVRVPDGASTGNLLIKTARGTSIPVFFERVDSPGNKVFKEKRSYAINFSVDVKVARASGPNTLYLWVPRPTTAPSQRNIQLLSRSMEPFVEGHRGASLYQLKDLSETSNANIALSYLVDVYAISTQVKPQSIKKDPNSPVRASYTIATPLIPSDNKDIIKTAEKIVGKERNPYVQARKVYDWLLRNGFIGLRGQAGGAVKALEIEKADAYSAALLFCALSRSLDIPAIPVSGFLVDKNRSTKRHFWAEFWIDGFGWIPVDPALGAGATPEGFIARPDAREFYFGNLDNQRVTFSRNFSILSPMDPRGRVAERDRAYALQTLWEEAVGGLESYSSLWSDLTVTGVY
ncbi:transglutaminase domain-containing protein [Treponema sp.]